MAGINMTVEEMEIAGIGKYIPTRTPGYSMKKKAYDAEKIWFHFSALRDQYRVKFTDSKGYVDQDLANKAAQAEVDALLIKRAGGEAVALPNDNASPKGPDPDEYLMEAEAFGDAQDGVTWKDIVMYAFENMDIKNVDPKLAPSPGAYAFLRRMQSNEEARTDFYKTIWPKTFTKEADKGTEYHDDGRSVVDLIKRLQGESTDNPAVG